MDILKIKGEYYDIKEYILVRIKKENFKNIIKEKKYVKKIKENS